MHCFAPDPSQFHECLKLASKVNKRDEYEVNPSVFTRKLLASNNVSPEGQVLGLFKLPCTKDETPLIIKTSWDGATLRFERGEGSVNQHMKNKAH